MMLSERGYTLVVAEKPDAARRIADALSGGRAMESTQNGVSVFRLSRGSEEYVVCAAQGHLYSISDPLEERSVYPIFDAEWYQSDLIDEGKTHVARRIDAIRKLSVGAARFVNACDFDVEGEAIGYNMLRYACGGKEKEAFRARFSTLTDEDLLAAFTDLGKHTADGLARAGRTRHLMDFFWGVNLSRVLSRSVLAEGRHHDVVSVGRVQGPTLNILAEKELEIRQFVPLPYWRVVGIFMKGKTTMQAEYSKGRLDMQSEAEKVRSECSGKEARVASVVRKVESIRAGPAFNLGDLQREAYRVFRLSPSRTLQIAERLYLMALISYPRTSSQKIPRSIGYERILDNLSKQERYRGIVKEIAGAGSTPVQGEKTDSAHPAIYPTGGRSRRALGGAEAGLLDLISRRFLAAFGEPATREVVSVGIFVGEHAFGLAGARMLRPGWTKIYGRYFRSRETPVPRLTEEETLKVAEIGIHEEFQSKPLRYNQSSLVDRMEREGIGTKATRAEIVSTLVERGYVTPGEMIVSDLGLSVVEAMERFAPAIVTTRLTRQVEDNLSSVESGTLKETDLLRDTVRTLSAQLQDLYRNEKDIGRQIDEALAKADISGVLGPCPVCRTGRLRVIRSRKTGKRFAGCTNYEKGCRATAPLPQKGNLSATPSPCEHCAWPVVYITGRGRPWKLCINMNCPSKRGKE